MKSIANYRQPQEEAIGDFRTDEGIRIRKDNVSPTLNSSDTSNNYPSRMAPLIYGQRIRRLTPTECERLQGFPDGWTLGSDTQRYKQCGNAVTVNVIEAIAKRLLA